jgi:CubicO group peptidase (beta-lactamase class C family)
MTLKTIWRNATILALGGLSACAARGPGLVAEAQPEPTPLPALAREFDLSDNGLIEREEAGPLLRPRFAQVDQDGSGALDGRELMIDAMRQVAGRAPVAVPAWGRGVAARPLDIDAGLETMVRDLSVSGAALICGSRGREIYRHAFGGITDETSVPIASASKWVSGLVVMQAVETGQVSLDTPLAAYLPDAPPGWRGMTLRQMFSHSAGTPRSHALRYSPDIAAGGLARTLMAGQPVASPGMAFAYGGESMQVGAFAVETATGATWRQLFDRGVTGPLHLAATRFSHPIWYDPDREIVSPNVAAGAWSSASDYFKVVTALAFPTDETRLLSDAGVAAMESDQTHALPQSFRPAGVPDDWSYGVGLWCERRAGERCLSVSSAGAFGTYPWVDRERGSYGVLVTLGDVKTALPHALRLRAMCEALPE